MISTRDLSLLPEIAAMQSLTQTWAMLDAILCPEREDRYFTFDAHWGAGEMLAAMDNGSGDDWFLLFNAQGAILKGFSHEAAMTPYKRNPRTVWPGVLDAVPPAFADFLAEPAFGIENTTFCIWRLKDDRQWQRGPIDYPEGRDPDGSEFLLDALPLTPDKYHAWAADYYEREIDKASVEALFAGEPLVDGIVEALEGEVGSGELAADIETIGYPQ